MTVLTVRMRECYVLVSFNAKHHTCISCNIAYAYVHFDKCMFRDTIMYVFISEPAKCSYRKENW